MTYNGGGNSPQYSGRPGEREPRVSSQSPEVNYNLRSSLIDKVAERLRQMGAEEFLQQHPLEAKGTLFVTRVEVTSRDAARYFNIQGEQFTPSILVVSDPSLRRETSGRVKVYSSGREGMDPDRPRLSLSLRSVIKDGRNPYLDVELPRAYRSPIGGSPYLYIGYDAGLNVPSIFLGPNALRPGAEDTLLMFVEEGGKPIIAPLELEDGWRDLFDRNGNLLDSAKPERSDFAKTMDRIDAIMGTSTDPEGGEQKLGETQIGPLRHRLWEAFEDNKISFDQYYEAGTIPARIRALLDSLETPAAEAKPAIPRVPVSDVQEQPQEPQISPVEEAMKKYLRGEMGMKEYLAIKHLHEAETGQSGYIQPEWTETESIRTRRKRDTWGSR